MNPIPMKKIALYSILIAVVFLFSCKSQPDEEMTTDVELTFKGKFGNETFLINQDFTYEGITTRFDQFNFYISDVVLVKEIGSGEEETELIEVEFVELSYNPANADAAAAGMTITAKNVPVGNYTAIRFDLGVPPDLNKTEWTDYGAGHPLRRVEYYWEAWESFIFAKVEARFDIDNDGSFAHKISYHTGSDEAFRTKFIAKEIQLKEGVTTNITMEVDALKIFDGIDILTEKSTHNLSDLSLVLKVMNNLTNKAITAP